MITFDGREVKPFDGNLEIEFDKYSDLVQANLTLNGEEFDIYFRNEDKERLRNICKQQ